MVKLFPFYIFIVFINGNILACETQGLFRITASLALVDELINRYESGIFIL